MWNCSERRKGVQQITEIESLESGKDGFGEKGKGINLLLSLFLM
jgi:hypothetical protein